MDIHVNVSRVYLEIYKIRYVRARENQSFVCLLDCLMEISMLHIAAVDEEVLMGALLTGRLRFGHKATNLTECRFDADGQQVLPIAATIDIGDALAQGAGTQVHQFLTVGMEGEVQCRVNQHHTLESC